MTTEQTIRSNGKWAKVSGSRGKWTVALGWAGQFAASKVFTTVTKDHANIIARNYIND